MKHLTRYYVVNNTMGFLVGQRRKSFCSFLSLVKRSVENPETGLLLLAEARQAQSRTHTTLTKGWACNVFSLSPVFVHSTHLSRAERQAWQSYQREQLVWVNKETSPREQSRGGTINWGGNSPAGLGDSGKRQCLAWLIFAMNMNSWSL